MKRSLTFAAAGILLATSSVATVQARASLIAGAAPPINGASCVPGTWVQLPADVTTAMQNGRLIADTIVSATDAWAVGESYPDGSASGSLWEHWTGGSRFNIVTSGGRNVLLRGVTNFGPNDVWAVGFLHKGIKTTAVISHWNGSTITRSALPKQGTDSALIAISGSSASDIWAMGDYSAGAAHHVLLYHFDGTAWSLTPAPPGAELGDGILDLAPHDVDLLAEGASDSNLYRYNGSTWSVADSNVPVGGPSGGGLVGGSDNDLYAVANTGSAVDHWNGSAWSTVGVSNSATTIFSVAEGPVGTVWESGNVTPSITQHVFVAANGVRATHPAAVMTQDGSLDSVASGFGLAIAVGGQYSDSPSEPIAVMSCNH